MRRFAANYIFPVSQPPLKNGIVEVDSVGNIINLIDTNGNLTESRNLEFYNGVIVPGFINAHCHLELSELKGKLNQGLTLPGFVSEMIAFKKQSDSAETLPAMVLHDDLMKRNGIVAVGDIVNTNKSIEVKQNSKIYYHTFIEALGLHNESNKVFNNNLSLYNQFVKAGLTSSIVPHAPYSVSEGLFKLIRDFAEDNNSILSIHMQESSFENEMFTSKKGKLVELFERIGIDLSNWIPTGESSFESIAKHLPNQNTILFIHNLYSSHHEIVKANKNFKNAYFILCPLSNYFIENKYPNLTNFIPFSDKVAIGTDSLASNNTLSILEEMKALVKINDNLSFEMLLQWATLNGARALQIDKRIGSIEIGKKPGINLITDFDFSRMNITEKSTVKVLI
jgi:aminodeoxyfutalosine deaminase